MRDKLLKQTRNEYSPKQRIIALVFLAPVFLLVLPGLLIFLGSWIDSRLQWSPILHPPVDVILGGLLILSGCLLAVWSIYSQFTIGRGTPVPLMATQKLIVQPPFSYCRNPMALGAIVMYSGVAIFWGSPGAMILVLLGTGCLLTYIKRIEEMEMEMRFGQEYLDYKHRTPFLLPRFWHPR